MYEVAILNQKKKEWAYQKWCEGFRQLDIAMALGVSEKTIQRTISGKPRIRPVLRYEDGED